jgi:hypothetical protein
MGQVFTVSSPDNNYFLTYENKPFDKTEPITLTKNHSFASLFTRNQQTVITHSLPVYVVGVTKEGVLSVSTEEGINQIDLSIFLDPSPMFQTKNGKPVKLFPFFDAKINTKEGSVGIVNGKIAMVPYDKATIWHFTNVVQPFTFDKTTVTILVIGSIILFIVLIILFFSISSHTQQNK